MSSDLAATRGRCPVTVTGSRAQRSRPRKEGGAQNRPPDFWRGPAHVLGFVYPQNSNTPVLIHSRCVSSCASGGSECSYFAALCCAGSCWCPISFRILCRRMEGSEGCGARSSPAADAWARGVGTPHHVQGSGAGAAPGAREIYLSVLCETRG